MHRKHFRLFGFVLIAALLLAGWAMPAQPGQAASLSAESCDTAQSVWIGTFGFGVNCLDQAGWYAYTQNAGSLPTDQVQAVAVCQDSVWVAHSLGLSTTDGKSWKSIKREPALVSVEGLACDGKSGVWIAHYQGVSHYDGAKWTTYEYTKLGSGAYANLVKDVAVAPDGKVWVVTSSSVAMFDGDAWTVYEQDKGFEQEYFFAKIVVDDKGMPWVGHGAGVLSFGGKTWEIYDTPALNQVESMTVDTEGHVWVGTYSKGVSMFDGKSWITFNRENSKLTSNHVKALAADAQGRIWIGTEWGLNVFDGRDWQAFHMSTSDLLDDYIYALAVSGKGPELPNLKAKKTGSLNGRIKRGSEPVSNATVVICTEFIGTFFTGTTPCSSQPFTLTQPTGKDGKFAFSELPVGRYGLTVSDPAPNGKWIPLTSYSGLDLGRVEVREGKRTDLGDLDISKTK